MDRRLTGYDSGWMPTPACWILAVMLTTGITVGQQKSGGQVKVLTVCEVLRDASRYANAAVAVVGRMERGINLIDHYEFLTQDRCEHPIITHGHVWPTKIQIWTAWEEGMPKAPIYRPKFKWPSLAAKVLADAEPHEWAVVYGRLVRVPNLNEDCGVEG